MTDTNVTNFDYDPDHKPNIIEHFRSMMLAAKRYAEEEERMMKDPDYRYERIHICSREIAEIMLSPDTPIETRIQLEWATFAGYQWVHKDESNVFIDGKLE